MKASEIIYSALIKLGKAENYSQENIMDSRTEDIRMLIYSLDNVLSELSEIFPHKTREKVSFVNGEVSYSRLSKSACRIYKVISGGVSISFREHADKVRANALGEADIEYSYRLAVNSEGEINLLPVISVNAIADGVTADYYLLNGFIDEAMIYEQKYREAIARAGKQVKSVRVKARRW